MYVMSNSTINYLKAINHQSLKVVSLTYSPATVGVPIYQILANGLLDGDNCKRLSPSIRVVCKAVTFWYSAFSLKFSSIITTSLKNILQLLSQQYCWSNCFCRAMLLRARLSYKSSVCLSVRLSVSLRFRYRDHFG